MKKVKVFIGVAVILVIVWILAGGGRTQREAPREAQVAISQQQSPEPKLVEPTATQISQPPRPGKKQWQDPEAREALRMVGVLPEAEQYWFLAINNPNLSANERQDLIEDLNEEGFSDPKNLRTEDLPLILSRIRLIEELAPSAMDKVNADAFQEAHKDLVNMARRLEQK